MLETEEVDDDYFTPVASASLANIFGKSSVVDERSDNESLKYTPPKPQNVNKQPEDSKASSCLFACVLIGHEWHNNVYLQKGRLGFALIKLIKTGTHNIILYDSNKKTLSNASVTSKSRLTVKSNNYISYYDDQLKYWSLYGETNEIKTILEILKTLDVTINTSTETDINPPDPLKNIELKPLQEDTKKNVESDTDSVTNRKTKASILNRMATMGHSVLPPNDNAVEKTSDSSDTNDTDYHIKAVRHKPIKGSMKRSSTDKSLLDQKIIDMHLNVENSKMGQITDIKNNSSHICDQLVPLANTTIVSSAGGNDMNAYITEQRISNSELRINMGRMTDKVDDILNKINKLELKEENKETSNINTEILHKLLKEYESKIKVYEELIHKMATDKSPQSVINVDSKQTNEEELKNKIAELEKSIKQKDEIVLRLQNEAEILRDAKEKENNVLQLNVSELEAEVRNNNILLKELTAENMKLSQINGANSAESKIKSLMNDTYQAVATNFENGETYSGESIKKAIGMVIKKVTISALSE